MNTKSRTTLWPVVSLLIGVAFFQQAISSRSGLVQSPSLQQDRKLPPLPLFLDLFLDRSHTDVATLTAKWTSANGPQQGYLARRTEQGRYPALILIPDERGLTEWFKQSAQEMASIGYVILTIEIDSEKIHSLDETQEDSHRAQHKEQVLAHLSSAVRYLRRREDIFPGRIGVVGWATGGRWAWELSASQSLKACVSCNSYVSTDPALMAGLRHTAVMEVRSSMAADDVRVKDREAVFQKLKSAGIAHYVLEFPNTRAGFMEPDLTERYQFDHAERAWFEIYEFLEAHLEIVASLPSATVGIFPKQSRPQVATIAELMRVVNRPDGVRGNLARALGKEPQDGNSWKRIRAQAAVIAETGSLLLDRSPPRGKQASWRKFVVAYRTTATSLATAAQQHDYTAAKKQLQKLTATCGACHLEHR